MKFTKLSTKFNKILKKKEKGKRLKSGKILKLQQLLNEKKSGYEKKLKTKGLSKEKRKSFESKLKVVNAQIKKSNNLLSK